MSKITDKIKNVFTVDYDDYDDDYYDDYEDEVEEKTSSASNRFSTKKTASKKTEMVDDYDELNNESDTETPFTSQMKKRATARTAKQARPARSKVVPIKNGSSMEVCVIKPTYYESTRDIIDTLLEGKPVILNLEGMKLDLAQRVVDTVSGGCYAIQGNLQKVNGYIYLVTPNSVDISGDFQDMVSESTSYSSTSYSRRNY